jgi:hypothetical protein
MHVPRPPSPRRLRPFKLLQISSARQRRLSHRPPVQLTVAARFYRENFGLTVCQFGDSIGFERTVADTNEIRVDRVLVYCFNEHRRKLDRLEQLSNRYSIYSVFA